jgi:membrane-bound inhibitor of C-type lysozyme
LLTFPIAALVLTLMACTSQPPQTDATRADAAPPGTANARIIACAPSQLALTLDSAGGRFNGMSHSGTMLVLRNTGAAACTIPARLPPSFAGSDGHTLNILAQTPTGPDAASHSPITLAPGAVVTSDMRWVSGDVYDNGHCEAPARLTLALDQQRISTAFTGRLCGAGGQPSTYALSTFTPAAAPVSTTAKPMAYACDDGRTVQAVYPDTDTATLTFDGRSHHLRIAVSASGASYVDDHWQWWSKGMHDAWLARLKPGENIASARGVHCAAP